ncbi:MAG: tetratricopeptide repeat protein [Ardenticatenaceae bacterium]|nr:tetratricopeptide repeat protein [Ardenticatenaceae bacterium]
MFDLSISLLGPFVAALGERPLYKFRTNKVQALLIYLVMEAEQVHRRETLMNLLWPDLPQPSAQVNLRQTIYRLRQAIPEVSPKKGKKAVPFLIAERQTVQINPEAAYFLDVTAFTEQIDTNPADAVALYRDDFLSDFYLSDSNEFEEWAQTQREALRRQVLDALEALTADCLQTADYDNAQTYAWKQLEIDNLREIAYRQLMIALMQSGQRSAALAQYHICRDRLRDELGVEPTNVTQTLYQQIQANTLPQEAQPVTKETKAKNGRLASLGAGFHTYLLTDIESVVQLWDRYQQDMIPALHRHNTILEEQISQHGGRILELHGDKVRAVFANGRPLTCALAIQEAFGREKWGRIGELRIRIGLHGSADIPDETGIIQTTPITAAAWGGQILASAAVHQGLKLPAGAFWQILGEHQLQDGDAPIALYGLLHPDLPHQNFPPLRTLSHQETAVPLTPLAPAIPHNLPQQPTPFIGREEELAALDELLIDPETRLMTIVGPGGMGKTRLALASAERQLAQTAVFPHGVFFVHLAHIQSTEQMIPTIAHALGFALEGSWQENRPDQMPGDTRTARAQIIDYLRHKQLLLILDNMEHLLAGAPLIAEILQTAPLVQIMVTSRERLQLREEQVYPIQGLDFPAWETPEDALQYTAVRLFVQAAHRVQPNFEITADDLTYLTRICRAVGGMPLGLELAASWVDMLSLPDIAAEIQNSLDLLETDVRNVPQRHRSIRAVFDYSWQQLTADEQTIFAQFAVFQGGFSRAAGQKITGASIRLLANLVSKSFLQYNQQRDRYELHELMRQYAAEKLAEDEVQATAVRNHHSHYYCHALQHRENKIRAGYPQEALLQIEADQDNARAAWHWAVDQGDLEGIDRAINGLCFFCEWRDRLFDGLAICEAASKNLRQMPPTAGRQRVLAKTLIWHGRFMSYLGQIETIQDMIQEAINLLDRAEEAGEDARAERAFALLTMSHLLSLEEGDRDLAWQQLEQCLELFRQLGDQWGEFSTHNALGNVARRMGNYHEARHRFEKNLNLARSQRNQWEIIRALVQLGWVARDLVAYDEARQLFEECLALSRTQNNLWGEVRALEALAYLTLFQGVFAASGRYLEQAFIVSRNNGFRSDMMTQRVNIAVVHWFSGHFEQAHDSLIEARALGRELNYPWTIAFPTTLYSELLALTCQYEAAREHVQQGLSILRRGISNPFVVGRAYRTLGWLALAAGQYGAAQDWFRQSIETYRSDGDDEAIAWSTAGTGHALLGLGNVAQARRVVADALWTAVELQAFIPLLFLLPITILLLTKQGQDKWAERLRLLAMRTPFLAKAPLFAELVWSQLPRLKKAPPIEETAMAELRRELWTAVAQLLAEDVLV